MTIMSELHDVIVVVVVMQQEECSIGLTSIGVSQVLEQSLVVGEIILVDSSICNYIDFLFDLNSI